MVVRNKRPQSTLFLTPLDRKFDRTVLSWKDAEKLPWGILIFFGGSRSLSSALTETGVTRWLSQELHVMHDVPVTRVPSGSATPPAGLTLMYGDGPVRPRPLHSSV